MDCIRLHPHHLELNKRGLTCLKDLEHDAKIALSQVGASTCVIFVLYLPCMQHSFSPKIDNANKIYSSVIWRSMRCFKSARDWMSWSESSNGLGTLDDDDIFEGPASCMFSTLIQISDARTSSLTSLLTSLHLVLRELLKQSWEIHVYYIMWIYNNMYFTWDTR